MLAKARSLSILFGAVVLTTGAIANAQPIPGTPYTKIDQVTEPFTPLVNPTSLLAPATTCCREVAVSLPFPVKVYNETYTTLSVGHGLLVMGHEGQVDTFNSLLPTTRHGGAAHIAAWWDGANYYPPPSTGLSFEVFGNAPSRRITFEWGGVANTTSTFGNDRFTFQVTLHEGPSGRIDFHYGPRVPEGNGYCCNSATSGMQGTGGTGVINFFTNCTSSCQPAHFDSVLNQKFSLVQDPGVELLALAVEAPQFATLGAPITVPVVVANLNSNVIGPFEISVGASTAEDGSNAVQMGSLTVSIGPFQTQIINIEVTPPISLGEANYYLVNTVDSAGTVNEVDETNNVITSENRVRFLPAKPDLAIDRVVVTPLSATAGQSITVYSTITNGGGEVAVGPVAIMLSSNPAISPQDSELDRFNVTLAPSETMTATSTFNLPADLNSGAYYIGALADPDGTVDEVSESNNGRAALQPIVVAGGNVAVGTTALPAAVVGQTYVAVLTALGGQPPYDWVITSGMLPMGIGVVQTTGEFFGRAQVPGNSCFTVQVTDSGGQTATADLCLNVSDPQIPLTIVSREVPFGVVGQEYTFQLLATGGTVTSSLAWSATGLPAGLALTETGVLAGTPGTPETSTVAVSVTNGPESAMRTITMRISPNASLQLIPNLLPPAVYDVGYTAQLEATGGVEPVNFFLQPPVNLPEGIMFGTDGSLSGTPLQVGTFRLVVEARDAAGSTDVNALLLAVADNGSVSIGPESFEVATVGLGYQQRLTAMGGTSPYTWSQEGNLPEGLIVDVDDQTNEFVLIGSPTQVGTTNLVVSVADSKGRSARRAYAIRVIEASTVPDPDPEDDGCGCETTSQSASWAWSLVVLGGLFFLRRRRR